jgi:hypothetical protein
VSPDRLDSIAAYAGDRLHSDGVSGPHPFGRHIPVTAQRAVYLVCAWSGRVLYVGSTTVGVDRRFAQHLSDPVRTLDWATAYVVPLTHDTPTAEVRRIEGRIGLAVGPERSEALPRVAQAPFSP